MQSADFPVTGGTTSVSPLFMEESRKSHVRPGIAGQSAEVGATLARDIQLVAAGDREAFRRVYASSADRLFAICLGITHDHAAAQDVLQDTFIKIWEKAAGFDADRSRPVAWLAAIARNTAIDWYRSQARHRHVGEDHLISLPSEAMAADERIISVGREEQAWSAVGDLDSESEDALKSVFLLGLSYPEAAARFELPVATFKSRVRRMVLKIRDRLIND